MINENILRLKDIENIGSENPDYSIIMSEVIGYKKQWFFRKKKFADAFKKAHHLIMQSRKINPKDVLIKDGIKIKKPNDVDNISFRAMMELQSHFGSYTPDLDFGVFVALIISIVCYQENCEGDYDSDSEKFLSFKGKVLDMPIWDMVGLYNWVEASLFESDKKWNQRFHSVNVEDKDYEQAGGHRMSQFNVITTIKSICLDFNCSYKKAWQMSYALSQTNSYGKATQNHIQDQMRQIKEAKMKSSRGN
tara:strand:- start:7519 stop:8265 length:747 start_codon:yes stop_codon:yes gene_type:complete